MARRKRTWTWRPWRTGLALELTDYRGMTCPWLSRTSGVPVERPDLARSVGRRLNEITVQIAADFAAFGASMNQAADALAAFSRAWAAR